MGVLLIFSCYLIEFAPALVLFVNLVAPDPLRIILFVLGGFFWLLALLFSGLLWFILYPLRDYLIISVFASVLIQEASRVALFLVLRRAQHGLHRMAQASARTQGNGATTIFHDLHNARHLMAVVTGLGMGVLAALFLTMNLFAALSGPGTIGLPHQFVQKNLSIIEIDGDSTPYLMEPDRGLPYYYAFSGMTLSLLHAAWTIQMWDSCHKLAFRCNFWYEGGLAAVGTHLFLTCLSFINSSGYQWLYLFVQFCTLFVVMLHCHFLMGGNFGSFLATTFFALRDWVTLNYLRGRFKYWKARVCGPTVDAEEMRREENEAIAVNQQPAPAETAQIQETHLVNT